MRNVSFFAILLGAAGLLPFVGCSLIGLAAQDVYARIALLGLVAYGAVILSFLGGVHWGLALAAGDAQTVRTQRLRFGLGVVPSLIGWAALLVMGLGWPKTALLVLAAGFVATTIAEARGTRAGMVPPAYMAVRWVLSIVVIVLLVSVCLVLALGGRVVL